jgi:hypothetical protein
LHNSSYGATQTCPRPHRNSAIDTCGAKKRSQLSRSPLEQVFPSRRSCAARAIAANLYVVIRGQKTHIFRIRQSSLEAWLAFLDEQWAAGCHNASELWRRLKGKGFRGGLGVVSEWARRKRRTEQASDQQLHRVPSAKMIARRMTMARDHLSKTDTMLIAAIEAGVPMLAEGARI